MPYACIFSVVHGKFYRARIQDIPFAPVSHAWISKWRASWIEAFHFAHLLWLSVFVSVTRASPHHHSNSLTALRDVSCEMRNVDVVPVSYENFSNIAVTVRKQYSSSVSMHCSVHCVASFPLQCSIVNFPQFFRCFYYCEVFHISDRETNGSPKSNQCVY